MRILLVNYRYFVSGGPERYAFNATRLLESHDHDVIPFSIAYDQNEPTPYESYFAPPLGGSSNVYFRDHTGGLRTYLTTLERLVYSRDVYRRLSRLVQDTQPNVALVLHYLRKLSPSVLRCLSDNGVPIAVRLSDFAMVCPNAHMLRNGRPCELCVDGGLWHSVRHRCVQESFTASGANYAATVFHRRAGYFDLIDRFITPSEFTRRTMIAGGWPSGQVVRIATPVDVEPDDQETKTPTPTIAYAGRLDPIKGVGTLIDAVALLRDEPDCPAFSVRIAGGGSTAYCSELKSRVAELRLNNVTFEGDLTVADLKALLREAWVSVVPSLWYENTPNAVLESMAVGTSVVASRHGSLLELVKDGATGTLVPPGDARSWADALKRIVSNQALAVDMGRAARAYVRAEHAPNTHYGELMELFRKLIDDRCSHVE